MKCNFSHFIYLIIAIICCSCKKESVGEHKTSHTVIVCMLANNNLYKEALENINQMESAWQTDYDGNLIVLMNAKEEKDNLYLIKIQHDNDANKISSPIVEVFNNMDLIESENLKKAIENTLKLYPSDAYSLVLWSHATGWLPPNTALRSFGESNDAQMDILDLKNAIPSNRFETLIFDACLMGGIEVVYEMREKADYIIASPSEILSSSFPYQSIVPLLFKENRNAAKIGQEFYEFYENQEGNNKSATIGVVKTSELEHLADITKKIMSEVSIDQLFYDELKHIQYYNRQENKIAFDFGQTISLLCEKNDLLALLFAEAMKNAVTYSAHTKYFMNSFEIKYCSGLSCFVPREQNTWVKDYYKNLEWYTNSGFYKFFGEN